MAGNEPKAELSSSDHDAITDAGRVVKVAGMAVMVWGVFTALDASDAIDARQWVVVGRHFAQALLMVVCGRMLKSGGEVIKAAGKASDTSLSQIIGGFRSMSRAFRVWLYAAAIYCLVSLAAFALVRAGYR